MPRRANNEGKLISRFLNLLFSKNLDKHPFYNILGEMIIFLFLCQSIWISTIFQQFNTQEVDSICKCIKFTNEKRLLVEVELSSFEFKLKAVREPSQLANVKMEYDITSFFGVVEYEKGPARLIIKGKKREESWLFGFKNKCKLALSPKVALYLDLNLEMGNSNLDLSGLKVAKLTLSTTGKSVVSFDSPNPVGCKDLCISAQMSSFEGRNLGNAGFEVFYFKGGMGTYTLDFRGEFSGRRRIEIMMGVGRLRLILPKEVSIRLKPGGFSLKSIHGLFEADEGWYESENWGTTKGELIVHIDGGFGILRVEIL